MFGPDQNKFVQWARHKRQNAKIKGVAFFFRFMKLSDQRGNSEQEFIDLELSNEQLELLNRAYSKYQGKTQTKAPFRE